MKNPRAIPRFLFLGSLLVAMVSTETANAQASEEVSRVTPAITALAVTPDGKSYVQGSQSGVFCRPLRGDGEWSIPTELEHVLALAFSPDRTMLAIAGGSPAVTGIVEFWSWPGRKLLTRLEGHEDVVYSVAWLPQKEILATAGADRMLRIWDSRSYRCLATLEGHSGPVLAVAASPDGRWLCSGSVDATIRVWNTSDWRLTRTLNNHLGTVYGLTFRPPGTGEKHVCLASASEDGTVRIWYPDIGRMVRIVRHKVPVFCLAWKQDGSRLYTGAKDGCLRLLDGDDQSIQEVHRVSQGWLISLAACPGDRTVVVGSSRGSIHSFTPRRRASF